jgi:hypothetical protein
LWCFALTLFKRHIMNDNYDDDTYDGNKNVNPKYHIELFHANPFSDDVIIVTMNYEMAYGIAEILQHEYDGVRNKRGLESYCFSFLKNIEQKVDDDSDDQDDQDAYSKPKFNIEKFSPNRDSDDIIIVTMNQEMVKEIIEIFHHENEGQNTGRGLAPHVFSFMQKISPRRKLIRSLNDGSNCERQPVG